MLNKYLKFFLIIFIIQFFLIFPFEFFSHKSDLYITIFEGFYPPLGGRVINFMYSLPLLILFVKSKEVNANKIVSFETKKNYSLHIFKGRIVPLSFIATLLITLSFIMVVSFSYSPELYLNNTFIMYIVFQIFIIFMYFIIILLLYSIINILVNNKKIVVLVTYLLINTFYFINFKSVVLEFPLDLGMFIRKPDLEISIFLKSVIYFLICIIFMYILFLEVSENMEVIDEDS